MMAMISRKTIVIIKRRWPTTLRQLPTETITIKEEETMATIKAIVWSLLSGMFVYLYMTNHFIKANWIAVIWIGIFALQMAIDMTRKDSE